MKYKHSHDVLLTNWVTNLNWNIMEMYKKREYYVLQMPIVPWRHVCNLSDHLLSQLSAKKKLSITTSSQW